MGSEERKLKILVGQLIAINDLGLGKGGKCNRDEINSGIISLGFKSQNLHKMKKDLEYLEKHNLIIKETNSRQSVYSLTEKGAKIANAMKTVYDEFRL